MQIVWFDWFGHEILIHHWRCYIPICDCSMLCEIWTVVDLSRIHSESRWRHIRTRLNFWWFLIYISCNVIVLTLLVSCVVWNRTWIILWCWKVSSCVKPFVNFAWISVWRFALVWLTCLQKWLVWIIDAHPSNLDTTRPSISNLISF